MLDFRQSAGLISAALEGRQTDINILRWIIGYQQDLSYDEFITQIKKPEKPEDKRTASQIIDDIGKLCQLYGM